MVIRATQVLDYQDIVVFRVYQVIVVSLASRDTQDTVGKVDIPVSLDFLAILAIPVVG